MNNAIQRITNYWAASWYFQLLVILTAIACLCFVTFSKRGGAFRGLSKIYLAALLTLFVGTDIIVGFRWFTGSKLNLLVEVANNIFNFIEAYVLLKILAINTVISHRRSQITLLVWLHALLTVIGMFVLFNSSNREETFRWNTFSTVIHFYIIVVPCIWHFYDMYKQNLPVLFRELSQILAVTSYSLISIPVFAVIEYSYISQYDDKITAIHYIFLCALCVSFCIRDPTIDACIKLESV